MKPFDPASAEAAPVDPPVDEGPAQVRPQSALPLWLKLVLALVALAAIAGPVAVALLAPPPPAPARLAKAITRHRKVVPKAVLPPVEPTAILAVAPEDARAINASVPFSTAPNPAARPFAIFGTEADRARAVDCLASAVYYEAGDDAVGQQAVAQVVLNRVRHPAFPKSVCGVVYQGQERTTGCQFTFTCDGALARYGPSEAAWRRAREVAQAALTGKVYRPVGHATHYHTDWVVPYWSSSLDKIVAVDTHLFFRWTGWWGTPPAFNRRYAGAEPNVPKLARLSAAHVGAATDLTGVTPDGTALDPLAPGVVPARGLGTTSTFVVALDRRAGADSFAALAARTCGDRPYCKFMGWADPENLPETMPIGARAMLSMSFSYLRDREAGFDKALWNCAEFRRADPAQCMKQQVIGMAPTTVTVPLRAQTVDEILKRRRPEANLNVPVELSGIRRRPGREWVPLSDPVPMNPDGRSPADAAAAATGERRPAGPARPRGSGDE